MSFYTRSTESFEEPAAVQVVPAAAPQEDCVTGALKSAAILSLLKGYVKFCIKRGDFASPDQILPAINPIVDAALNNGDIINEDVNSLVAWIDKQKQELYGDQQKENIREKIVKCAFCCEMETVDGSCAGLQEFKDAVDAYNLAATKVKAVVDKYRSVVDSAITDFIGRYGKLFNESFIAEL